MFIKFISKNSLRVIFRETFQVFTTGYLILLLVETIKSGFVTSYINLNYLLGLVLISGLGMVLMDNKKVKRVGKKERTGKVDLLTVGAFALFTGAVVFYKTKEMGGMAIFVAIVSILISFMTMLLASFSRN